MRTLTAASLAALVALASLLAAAAPAQAAPSGLPPIPPLCDLFGTRALRAACETVFWGIDAAAAPVNCLLNTAPVNWLRDCTTGAIGPAPIVTYLLCYYNTPPSMWASTCV